MNKINDRIKVDGNQQNKNAKYTSAYTEPHNTQPKRKTKTE